MRYHLRRQGEERSDGRKEKPFLAEAVEEVIAGWFGERGDAKRPVNVVERIGAARRIRTPPTF